MLKTVHEYLNRKWDETGFSLERIRSNIIAANPSSSISVSKLHRMFSDPNYKLSIEELLAVVKAMGQDPKEILAIIGEQEYVASEVVGYKGAETLIAEHQKEKAEMRRHFEGQIERAKEIRLSIQSGFDKALVALKETYEAMLAEKDTVIAAEAKHSGAAMRSVRWWRGVAVGITTVLAGLLIYIAWELTHLDKGATAVIIQMVKEGIL